MRFHCTNRSVECRNLLLGFDTPGLLENFRGLGFEFENFRAVEAPLLEQIGQEHLLF